MIIRLLLALLVLVFLFWLSFKWRKLPQKKRKSVAVKGILIGAGIIILLAVFTGRMHWLGAVFAGMLALGRFGLHALFRALPFLRILRSNPLINNPRFKTQYLDVNVNLQNGQIYGKVIDGPLSGKNLSDLTESELDQLENFYKGNNKASLYLIRVVRHKPQTSHGNQQGGFPSTTTPTIEEAFQVLGLSTDATKKDVIKSHRSLMQKLHPDRGGNDYLASRVNLAKDVLIEHFDKMDT